ncbi:MAG: dipeptidase [Planctomycetota bacterium]|jgi:membrane dipeptidase
MEVDNIQNIHPFSELETAQSAWQRGIAVLGPAKVQLEHGLELHRQNIVCDHFGFLPSVWGEETASFWSELKEGNVGARELEIRSSLKRAVAATRDKSAAAEFTAAISSSGVNCMVQTVAEGKNREEDIKRMAAFRQIARIFRKTIAQVGSVNEINEAVETGRVAQIWSVNGPPLTGSMIDRDEEFSWVEAWYNLGVRLMHMTYNRRNVVGDGCSEPADAGLSDFGRELIARLNNLGIIVDVPHAGNQTTVDAAKASGKPVMASHTGAKGVFNHMRCKSDEAIKAIAESGGMLGVYALPRLLGPNATLNTLLDHVDYIARIAGVEYVGIGTDTCYQGRWPDNVSRYEKSRFTSRWWGNWKPDNNPLPFSDEAAVGSLAWTNWPLFTVGLVMRGYSDSDIEKILSGNFLRILEENFPNGEVEFSS